MVKTWEEATAQPTDFSVSDALEAFDGRPSALYAAFAGVDTSVKGYYKQPAYKAAQRNFERWRAAQRPVHGPLREGEKGKQARTISPANQKKLDTLVQKKLRRDRPLPHVSIRGRILVNGSDTQRRARRIEKSITWAHVDAIHAVAKNEGDTAAWQAFSEWYGGEGLAMRPIETDISIS